MISGEPSTKLSPKGQVISKTLTDISQSW